MQPEIRTERLLLRPLCDGDIDAFAAMNRDPRVMEFFPGLVSRDETEALVGRIRASVVERGVGMWAVELPERADFIGIVGLHQATFAAPFTPCVEVGWRLAADHWGQGYATEAARASLDYGFGTRGLSEILSWTVPDNRPSRRVMEKIGMKRDVAGDFDHPRVPAGHLFERHVLYRISN